MGVPSDTKKSNFYFSKVAQTLPWFEAKAKTLEPVHLFNMALCYEYPQIAIPDDAKVLHFYQLAADLGHARAQCNLGVVYSNGQHGVPSDPEKAANYYRLAAAQGDVFALCNLGLRHSKGIGAEPSKTLAFENYMKAAQRGYSKGFLFFYFLFFFPFFPFSLFYFFFSFFSKKFK